MSAEALQRERRQMQAKHLWYNVDIRWGDLKDKPYEAFVSASSLDEGMVVTLVRSAAGYSSRDVPEEG